MTLALKLIGAPVGLVVLVLMLKEEAAFHDVGHAWRTLLVALLVNQLALTLFAIRMRSLLGVFGISIGLLDAHRIHLQSLFYFFFVPMSVGMEVSRFLKVSTLVAGVSGISLTAALIVDRVVGALAAGVVALLCLPYITLASPLNLAGGAVIWASVGVAVAVLLAGWLVIRRFTRGGQLESLARAIRTRPGSLASGVGVSLLMQLCMGGAVFFAATAFGVIVAPVEVVFAVAASMFALLIPVSVVGAGPVEVAAVGVFVALGVQPPDAVLLASIVYSCRLVGALQGGFWEFFEGGRVLAAKAR